MTLYLPFAAVLRVLDEIKRDAAYVTDPSFGRAIDRVEFAVRLEANRSDPRPARINWTEAPAWAGGWCASYKHQDHTDDGRFSVLRDAKGVWLEHPTRLAVLDSGQGWDFSRVGRVAPAPVFGYVGNWYESLYACAPIMPKKRRSKAKGER